MTHSTALRNFVASFEGYESTAYQDQGGIWTLGFGHTSRVQQGQTCTRDEALAWLDMDLTTADSAVNAAIKIALEQYEFDACVSLAYNIGWGNFEKSTLARVLSSGDHAAASAQFLVWDKVSGIVNHGLLRRRTAEQSIFLGQTVANYARKETP